MKRAVFALLLSLLPAVALAQEPPLSIVHYGPTGELSSLEQANEVRVVFSKPIVRLGRIPQPVQAPFFRITPSLPGAFRWSGTTTLIFTPDKSRIASATKYTVTIDQSVRSISGAAMKQPLSLSFTTPTVRLLQTNWYRKGGKDDGPVVIALRFNQPIDPQKVAQHVRFTFTPHDASVPELSEAGEAQLAKRDPAAAAKLDAKVQSIEKAAAASGPVFGFVATEWDRKRIPPGSDLLVYETRPGIPSGSSIRVEIDGKVPSAAGPEVPGNPQQYGVELEPSFFVTRVACTAQCDPEVGNSIIFTSEVDVEDFRKALTVIDITDPAKEVKLTPAKEATERDEEEWDYDPNTLTLEDAGYSIRPARTYLVMIDPSLLSATGQSLQYRFAEVIECWHRRAFSSFGDGHGVWESSGGAVIPFSARNLTGVTQWGKRLDANALMPLMLDLRSHGFRWTPDSDGTWRTLNTTPDKIQSFGYDASSLLSGGKGLFFAAIRNGSPIPRAEAYDDGRAVATMVQVTNLGITVKDSPQNTLIMVTRLDDGAPVAGANVSIRGKDNKVFWSGRTDASGVALVPNTKLRENTWELSFVVIAEKDGDVAYVGSDWNEGIHPWAFGIPYDSDEARPLLRGTVFVDRGVYKLGEEVHAKAILRSDTPEGMRLLPAGTKLEISVRDPEDAEIDNRTVTLNQFSSADWTFKVPTGSPLGDYAVTAKVTGQRNQIDGTFLVAAYRRPDFRVDATLSADEPVAGAKLKGVIAGRYLFGGAMNGRDVHWTYSKSSAYRIPDAILDRFPADRFQFAGENWWSEEREYDENDVSPQRGVESVTIQEKDGKLDKNGNLVLDLDTDLKAGKPLTYTLEGNVTDVSRQTIAGRTSLQIHPAPWYIGVKNLPYFIDAKDALRSEIVAVAPSGKVTPGVEVTVTLTQLQWNSVRRAEGNGFYTWDVEQKEIPSGERTITSAEQPVPFEMPLKNGGFYVLTATAGDGQGRTTRTVTSFYAMGGGYTAWQRYDHNRIDLVPEKKLWKPGEDARIMIKSPWEEATALLTTEREGIRSHRQFRLTSTQTTITVPITEADIPNLYVSVMLIKGRSKEPIARDGSDPGKPAFRLGYTELKVLDASKRLAVDLTASQEEYRPGAKAKVQVAVRDAEGKGAKSEVTLWAVDYGVLSLTGYRTPDVLGSVWVEKSLQVMTEDSRQRIISRRVMTPKGASEGGGGGMDFGTSAVRKDFRVLAFWVGSLVTDDKGEASTEVKLPESLTTYRIMAVAGDTLSRFGRADREVRTNKPVMLKGAFPRFMTIGDKALFGSVVHSQLKQSGTAIVTIKSLDPEILAVSGQSSRTVEVQANTPNEVRFEMEAKAIGNARLLTTVRLGGEEDAFEDVVPVRFIASPETVAAYGVAAPRSEESLQVPQGVIPSYGGLRLELASTALVGLSEGARYLVDYPYGCAEQRSSAAYALMLANDVGEAFKVPGISGKELRTTAQQAITEVEAYQCTAGGFAFWKGDCSTVSPYLTAYVLQVLARADGLGYTVREAVLENGYSYLEQELLTPEPGDQGWWPAYNAWQAYAVKILTEGGRQQDSNINRLMERLDRMPAFAIAYLHDALVAKGETSGARAAELRRRMQNAILPEAGASHVEELNDPYLLWFWNSNVRSTAIVLGSLVRGDADPALVRSMVRWLMQVRKKGRWGNTQENATALAALVDYYQKYESETPQFVAKASLGGQALASSEFEGRSTTAKSTSLPMTAILKRGAPGTTLPLVFERQGTGTLHYVTRFSYVSTDRSLAAMDQGFSVERSYAPADATKPVDLRSFKAGDTVRVTLKFTLTKERRFVAVTDPLPAGFEPVEAWFATTAASLARETEEDLGYRDWSAWWREGGFDHVERHDDRVNLFATRLDEGEHVFSYLARATTSGTFNVAPTRVEEMYTPEIFGRSSSVQVEVKK